MDVYFPSVCTYVRLCFRRKVVSSLTTAMTSVTEFTILLRERDLFAAQRRRSTGGLLLRSSQRR